MTADIIWELGKDEMEEVKLTKIQLLRFQKAQQKHQISHSKKNQGKNERQQPSSDTYGRYHVTTIYSGFAQINIAGRIISNIFFMIRANENPI